MHLCGGDGLLTGTQPISEAPGGHHCRDGVPWPREDPEEHQRQLKKKQKNRAAAQRSRQKHTDKADALHQQHESLEKHNHALRKEIQALQAELARWSRTLHMHERLCCTDCASCLAPGSLDCWDQTEKPLVPTPHGKQGCQEQPGLFQTPVCSPLAQQLSPGPQPHNSPGLLSCPLLSLSLDTAVVTAPPAQLSPSPVLSASPTGYSLLESSSKLSALLLSPTAQPDPLQPLGLEHPTRGRLGSSPHNPSPALRLACQQSREHEPAFPAADWQGLSVDPSPHPLLAFPLLSSAQVHF